MDIQRYYQELLIVSKKTLQVLSIKKQLLEKRKACLRITRSSNNVEEVLKNLEILENTYRREKRVMEIVNKGVVETLRLLREIKVEVNSLASGGDRIKNAIRNKIPFIKKDKEASSTILLLFGIICRKFRKEFLYVIKNLRKIEKVISDGHEATLMLIGRVKDGKIMNSVPDSDLYKTIEGEIKLELEIISKVDVDSSKRILGLRKYMQDFKNFAFASVKRRRVLLGLQTFNSLTPGTGLYTATLSYYFGAEFFPLFYLLLQLVEYGPTIAAVVLERKNIPRVTY